MQSLRPLLAGGRPRAVPGLLLSPAWIRQHQHQQQRRQQHQQAEILAGHETWAQKNKREVEAAKKRRQESVPLYDLPRVVLDLDAEDSPHVRPYDEVMEVAEAARWRDAHASVDDLAVRLAAFAEDAQRADARLAAVAATPSPWRVTDRDIWAAVLDGGVRAEKDGKDGKDGKDDEDGHRREAHPHASEEAKVMGELLYQNGVSARIAADAAKTVPFLLQRQAMARRQDGGSDPALALTSDDAFGTALARCGSFAEVRRLLSLTTRSSAQGCRAVAQAGAVVAARLASFFSENTDADAGADADTSTSVSTSTLVMLLNLSHSFEAKGVGLGPDLCGLGLQAAAKSMEPAAMRCFLGIGFARGYFSGTATVMAAESSFPTKSTSTSALDASVLAALSALHAGLRRQHRQGALSEIFAVLVGGTTADAMCSSGSFRAAMLAADFTAAADTLSLSSASSSPPVRQAYLRVLAELGAVRTLWQELQLCRPEGSEATSSAGVASTYTVLTTCALRYAKYTEHRRPTEERRKTATANIANRQYSIDDGRQSDLQMLRAYEEAAEAGKLLLPEGDKEAAVRPEAAVVPSKQFQTDVREVFFRAESAEDAVDSIHVLLSQLSADSRATD